MSSVRFIPLEVALERIRRARPDFVLPEPAPIAEPMEPSPRPVTRRPVRRKTLAAKVWSFSQAAANRVIGEDVPLAVYQARLPQCESGVCGWLVREQGTGNIYCGACGCPTSQKTDVTGWAELHTKLWIPNAACPCEEPLFEAWEPGQRKSAGRVALALLQAAVTAYRKTSRGVRGEK